MEHCRPFHRVGIVGIGGLGHLAIQFAAKIGCHVSVFSTTPEKEEEARRLGAHQFFCSSTVAERVSLCGDGSIDRLLITSSSKADLGMFYSTLHRNAVVVLLSVGDGDLSAPYMPTLLSGMSIAGSCMCSRYMQYVNDLYPCGELRFNPLQDQNARLCCTPRHSMYCGALSYDIKGYSRRDRTTTKRPNPVPCNFELG
jgi:D-arabinose 1-dehydrogenase-like Zn-dependent alcohol dehydrogenase